MGNARAHCGHATRGPRGGRIGRQFAPGERAGDIAGMPAPCQYTMIARPRKPVKRPFHDARAVRRKNRRDAY